MKNSTSWKSFETWINSKKPSWFSPHAWVENKLWTPKYRKVCRTGWESDETQSIQWIKWRHLGIRGREVCSKYPKLIFFFYHREQTGLDADFLWLAVSSRVQFERRRCAKGVEEGHSRKLVLWGAPCKISYLLLFKEELDKEKWEERAWPSDQGWHRPPNHVKLMTFLKPLKSTWPDLFFFFFPVAGQLTTYFRLLLSHISPSPFFPCTFLLYLLPSLLQQPHPHSCVDGVAIFVPSPHPSGSSLTFAMSDSYFFI